ncbi:MFS transporter [Streptomyces malaysiensis]|uniref:MFS transporter n=1 Tax=Streptomyces malaysiensis subsp. samsunensis TaxID=459658 RepID=A0A9X2M627_STRMQ|nr:MFS transporter [Streptomyces samsunensis]MCQ8835480.1 MFS transporter [Streptomyces samsunensis]
MTEVSVPLEAAALTRRGTSVDRRLNALPIPPAVTIGFIGSLLVISADTETLAVVPLLGAINETFHMTPAQGAWSLSASTIAGAATVPLLARLGDIFGVRRMLLISLLFIVVGNIVCAVATGPSIYIGGRAILGISAAYPLFYAVLRLRAGTTGGVDRISGLMTAAMGAGIAISFLLGGFVLDQGGTVRHVLWIMTALSVLVLALAWAFVPDSTTRTRSSIDYLGTILVAGALSALSIGIGQGNKWGWTSSKTIALLAVAVVLMVVWAMWELKCQDPLLDLRIMRRREVWPAYLAAAAIASVAIASTLAISFYVQTPAAVGYGFGGTVLATGVYLLPVGLIIAFGGSLMGPVIGAIGPRASAVAGGVLAAVMFFWFASNHTETWQYIVALVILGLSYSLTYTASMASFLRAARPGEGGMLTGGARVANTAIASLGPTIVTAVLTASFIPNTAVPRPENYDYVWLVFAASGLVIAAVALLMKNSPIDQSLADKTQLIGDSTELEVRS